MIHRKREKETGTFYYLNISLIKKEKERKGKKRGRSACLSRFPKLIDAVNGVSSYIQQYNRPP